MAKLAHKFADQQVVDLQVHYENFTLSTAAYYRNVVRRGTQFLLIPLLGRLTKTKMLNRREAKKNKSPVKMSKR